MGRYIEKNFKKIADIVGVEYFSKYRRGYIDNAIEKAEEEGWSLDVPTFLKKFERVTGFSSEEIVDLDNNDCRLIIEAVLDRDFDGLDFMFLFNSHFTWAKILGEYVRDNCSESEQIKLCSIKDEGVYEIMCDHASFEGAWKMLIENPMYDSSYTNNIVAICDADFVKYLKGNDKGYRLSDSKTEEVLKLKGDSSGGSFKKSSLF